MMFSIIKKYWLLYVAVLLLLGGCTNKRRKETLPVKVVTKINTADTASERFTVFFKRFNTDSVFQISRIIFPLKLTIIGGEGESDTLKFLQKKDWRFDDHTKQKDII